MAVVRIDMEKVDFESATAEKAAVLKLLVLDTDGEWYSLDFEDQALSELASIFQSMASLIPRRRGVQ